MVAVPLVAVLAEGCEPSPSARAGDSLLPMITQARPSLGQNDDWDSTMLAMQVNQSSQRAGKATGGQTLPAYCGIFLVHRRSVDSTGGLAGVPRRGRNLTDSAAKTVPKLGFRRTPFAQVTTPPFQLTLACQYYGGFQMPALGPGSCSAANTYQNQPVRQLDPYSGFRQNRHIQTAPTSGDVPGYRVRAIRNFRSSPPQLSPAPCRYVPHGPGLHPSAPARVVMG